MQKEYNVASTRQVLWVLWGVMLVSQFVFMAVAKFVLFNNLREDANQNIATIFLAITVAIIGLSEVMYRKARNHIRAKANEPKEELENIQRAMPLFLVTWAMAELITIFGLVVPIVAGNAFVNYAYGFFATGLVLHLFRRP